MIQICAKCGEETNCHKCDEVEIEFEWESIWHKDIDKTHFTYTDRAKVLGGWLVNHRTCAGSRAHESSIFVPDPEHKWRIKK